MKRRLMTDKLRENTFKLFLLLKVECFSGSQFFIIDML